MGEVQRPGEQRSVRQERHHQGRPQARGGAGATANDVEHRRARPEQSAAVPSTRAPGSSASLPPRRSRCPSIPGGGRRATARGRRGDPCSTSLLRWRSPPRPPPVHPPPPHAAPPARSSAAAERAITADSIRAHVRFLASDLLEGRGPGTRGDALAQAYIAAQFEALGLRPAGTQGFLQPFDIVGVDGHAETIQFTRGRESLVLRHAEDVVAVAGDEAPRTAVDRADLVFVGYGIRAPEYAWDDFKGQDLRGKVLLILNSDPEDDP